MQEVQDWNLRYGVEDVVYRGHADANLSLLLFRTPVSISIRSGRGEVGERVTRGSWLYVAFFDH